jgi:hypothetical protein
MIALTQGLGILAVGRSFAGSASPLLPTENAARGDLSSNAATLPRATESKERPSETYPDGGWRVRSAGWEDAPLCCGAPVRCNGPASTRGSNASRGGRRCGRFSGCGRRKGRGLRTTKRDLGTPPQGCSGADEGADERRKGSRPRSAFVRSHRRRRGLWALKGLNLRLPPCEEDQGVDSPSEK